MGAAAIDADADDAQQVLRNLELMLGRHRVLNGFEFRREELDNLAALRTDHVIVMLMFVVVFVVRAPIAEADFTRESGFSQDLQGSIDCGLANSWIFFLYELIKIFVRDVIFSAEENVEDEVALGGAFHPMFLNVFEEDFLLFGCLLCRGHW